MAEIGVKAAQLSAYNVTRVTVEAGGLSQDLTRNPSTGDFNGTLILPEGNYDLVARAYADTRLVGQSNPTPMEIRAGTVTRVTLRILDTTGGGQPNFGPIVESLTYPTNTQAGTVVSFAISVLAPRNDPVSITWSSDCADATFSAPESPTTNWSKASQGTCRITVTATSNGLSVTETFSIVVFPAGSGSGAVEVNGLFVSAPLITLDFNYDNYFCSVRPDSFNASCPGSTASPSTPSYNAFVYSWGNSTPGSVEVFDSCGGTFGATYRDSVQIQGRWLPPVQGQVCIITARAVNGDGVVAELSAAILVRTGTPRTASPPRIEGYLSYSNGCPLVPEFSPTTCPPVLSFEQPYMNVYIDWRDGLPGTVSVTDDCGGRVDLGPGTNYRYGYWYPAATPGATCRLTLRATNLEGQSSETVGVFPLL